MLGGKRRPMEAEKWVEARRDTVSRTRCSALALLRRAGTNEDAALSGPGSAATTPRGRRVAQHPEHENSALSFGTADHALGDQGLDLAPGISEFRQHLSHVLAEFWREVAQTRLAAFEADRGGDPLVPVLFDDVAAVDGMGVGQRGVDRLHRPGRQTRSQQAVAERLGVVLTEHRG